MFFNCSIVTLFIFLVAFLFYLRFILFTFGLSINVIIIIIVDQWDSRGC